MTIKVCGRDYDHALDYAISFKGFISRRNTSRLLFSFIIDALEFYEYIH